MTEPAAVVFLLDVDNTLLDNDRVNDDLKRYLTQTFARGGRAVLGDFRAAPQGAGLRRLPGHITALPARKSRRPKLSACFLLPVEILVRQSPVSWHARRNRTPQHWGPTVILSDGDVIFQPRKVRRGIM